MSPTIDIDGFRAEDIAVLLQNLDKLSSSEMEELATLVEELERRKDQQRIQNSLLLFCKHMGKAANEEYKVGAHHRRLAALLEDIEQRKRDRICVSVPPRHGKLCAHDTLVPTPSGYKRHGDLAPGDYVFGLNGRPVEVVAVSPEGYADYEVELSNGEVVRVHGNHEWSVYDRRKNARNRQLETHETHQLAGDFWIGVRGTRGGRARWQLPDAAPLQYPACDVPLHPYALGVWLGDGTTGKPAITGVDAEVFTHFEVATGYASTSHTVHKDTGVTTNTYAGPRPGVRGQLSESLFGLGLLQTRHRGVKRVPPVYKYNSFGVRLQLLAGLIDTDGHVERGSGRVRIVTVDPDLAEDIREVAASLGFRPYVTSQEPTTSTSGICGRRRVYTVGFQPTCPIPTVLARKQITNFAMRRKVSIVDVRRCAPVPGRCIQVASRGGLYLVGKTHSPTHNSQLVSIYYAAWYLGRNPGHKVMLVSHTTDLAVDFGRKIRNLIATPAYQEVFPNVSLAADSKSAGRWSTNHGGEFFACLDPDTRVRTTRGAIRAGDVRLGDELLSPAGRKAVLSVMETTHSRTVSVAGGRYSADHPIWSMNRGWVRAEDIVPEDVLCAESFLDRLKAIVWRAYHGLVEHPHVQTLVQYKVAMREPAEREVSAVRRARHLFGRAVAGFRRVLSGYGGSTLLATHGGPHRQQRPVQSGELPVGFPTGAVEQQTHQRTYSGHHAGRACATVGLDPGGAAVSDVHWLTRGSGPLPAEEAAQELQAYRDPDRLGWGRRCAARVLAQRRRERKPQQPDSRAKGYMARLRRAAEDVFGLLLGVRRAGPVVIGDHEPRTFVNFRVPGDNSFFSSGVLTHNCGVGSALAGRGAHLLLIDDPHSEQDILNGNLEVFSKAYEWFTFGARTRLMPGGAVAIIHTRWSLEDLIGRVTRDMVNKPDADQYEVFEFPAIMETEQWNDETQTTEIVEKALWPEFFDLPALKRTKASMPTYQWNAQYQQNPTSEEAAVVKREWWQQWTRDEPPACEYIISSLDAAAEKNTRADYTALTTWGVFFNEETDRHELILLNSVKDRFEFPELKALCLRHWTKWEPDSFIVEKKSAGTAIYQELRRTGIPVQEYTPHRGTGDKYARLNSVADIVASGLVWVPDRKWAEEVVEEIAAFPYGTHDDLVDSTVMALMRFRQGGFIRLPSDYEDEPLPYVHNKEYY